MAGLNALLSERFGKKPANSKMAKMASAASSGNLNSFSGMFPHVGLTEKEKTFLEAILHEYTTGKGSLEGDLSDLIDLTSEVKAINAQAAILHGERIHKAHAILTRYAEGAFTTWLMAAYGNRQTPYNFMQYYLFYSQLPDHLRPQIEIMPRQAVYTLATRQGPFLQKQEIVENYKGETKAELLSLIREAFPLNEQDRRRRNNSESIINALYRLDGQMKSRSFRPGKKQRGTICTLLEDLMQLVER